MVFPSHLRLTYVVDSELFLRRGKIIRSRKVPWGTLFLGQFYNIASISNKGAFLVRYKPIGRWVESMLLSLS